MADLARDLADDVAKAVLKFTAYHLDAALRTPPGADPHPTLDGLAEASVALRDTLQTAFQRLLNARDAQSHG